MSVIAVIFEAVSTLVLTPVLVKTIGQSEFGVYKMCLSIVAYVLLLDLGIGNSVIRFASKYRFANDKANENKLAGVSLLFYLVISFLALAIGVVIILLFPIVFSKGLSSSEIALGRKLVFLATITSSVTLGTSGFYNLIIAHERFFVSKGLAILQILLKILFSFLVLKMGFGAIGVSLVNLVLTTIVRFLYVLYAIVFLKIRPKLKNNDSGFIKSILAYSALIAVQMVATQMNQSLDQILIGSLVSQSSSILGVYAVGSQINQYFMSIGVAITGVLLPGIVKFIETKPSKEALTCEMSRLSRLILFPLSILYVGFVVLGRQFVTIWVGEFYEEAYYVALLLISPQLLVSVFSPSLQLLWATNRQKEMSWVKLAIVAANCLLTVLLIHWNPLIGASLGTMISVLLGDVVLLLAVAKTKTKLLITNYLADTLGRALLVLIPLGLVSVRFISLFFSVDNWLKLFISGFAILVVVGIALFAGCLNSYERQRITKAFEKLLWRFKVGKKKN